MARVPALPIGQRLAAPATRTFSFKEEDSQGSHQPEITRRRRVADLAVIFALRPIASEVLFDLDGPVSRCNLQSDSRVSRF
jgi:hypothetical protein